jgi:ABC-type antimicrobial peptide transport system permease subunit
MSQASLVPEKGSGLTVDVERTWRGRLRYFWQLLWRDKSGLLGLSLFLLLVFTAVFAPVLAPHDPLDQNLSDSKTPPFWQEGGSTEYLLYNNMGGIS